MLIELKKNPRVTAKELKDSVKLANNSVHESTIRKTLNRNGIHGRTPQRKPLLYKKNIAACLKFAEDHLDTPQHYWENVLWTDETKIKLFEKNLQRFVWCKKKKVYQHENTIPTVKYGGGNIMVWGFFAASGPGPLAIMEGKMNSQFYQDNLKDNLKVAVQSLQRHKIHLLEWPSQSPDLNPIEMLWNDLKRAIHTRRPKNMARIPTSPSILGKGSEFTTVQTRIKHLLRVSEEVLKCYKVMKGAISLHSCRKKRLLTADEFKNETEHSTKYPKNFDVKEHSLDVQQLDAAAAAADDDYNDDDDDNIVLIIVQVVQDI
ncbi:hypothetical protein QTP70_002805 [Hemibagrus guttatus]|uniref:Transposase n=1 Tax=Hemibagrus guttatus TaxID=175788 RepID=A0AAE0QPF9_9TELE|nr:hypothetical protein QTP70_002805 [Hemibagrus guttatus]